MVLSRCDWCDDVQCILKSYSTFKYIVITMFSENWTTHTIAKTDEKIICAQPGKLRKQKQTLVTYFYQCTMMWNKKHGCH